MNYEYEDTFLLDSLSYMVYYNLVLEEHSMHSYIPEIVMIECEDASKLVTKEEFATLEDKLEEHLYLERQQQRKGY